MFRTRLGAAAYIDRRLYNREIWLGNTFQRACEERVTTQKLFRNLKFHATWASYVAYCKLQFFIKLIIHQYLTELPPVNVMPSRSPFGQALKGWFSGHLSKEARAKRFERLAEHFLNYGAPDLALSFARRARKIKATAERHDNVLRCLLYATGDRRQEFFEESLAWSRHYENKSAGNLVETTANDGSDKRQREAPTQYRVGLVGEDLDLINGYQSLLPQLRFHSNKRVRFFLYLASTNVNDPDNRDYAARGIQGLSTEEAASRIRADRLDFLFEIGGRLSGRPRFDILERRLAPIQVSWRSDPSTTGLDCVDFVMADAYTLTETQSPFLKEKPIRLPRSASRAWQLSFSPEITPLPAQSGKGITFASFNDMPQINAHVLDTWAEILARVPGSRLFLMGDRLETASKQATIIRHMTQKGIAPSRLKIQGNPRMTDPSALPLIRQRYEEIDIALDTFPFSGGTAATIALWQGVPVISLASEDWRGRAASALMESANLGDFVASSVEDYIEKAVLWAGRLDELAALRPSMRLGVSRESSNFRMDRFAKDFEWGLDQMWRETYGETEQS